MNARPFKLVVFDLGGTLVDHGCLAPVLAMVQVFGEAGITVSTAQARRPMGLHKRDHIRELLRMPEIAAAWQQSRGSAWTEADVQALYEALVPVQTEIASRYAELVPGALECARWLRARDIALAVSTGYPRAVAQPILDQLSRQGLQLDASVCADETPAGRPAPWMIFRAMQILEIFPTASVVKVGDTAADMQAAHNAGVWGIAVTETGTEFGLDERQLNELSPEQRETRHRAAERKLRDAGAGAVIRSLFELPEVLESL